MATPISPLEAESRVRGSRCRACGAAKPSLNACAACRSALYCDATCQRSDWARHKPECKAHVAAVKRDSEKDCLRSAFAFTGDMGAAQRKVALRPANIKAEDARCDPWAYAPPSVRLQAAEAGDASAQHQLANSMTGSEDQLTWYKCAADAGLAVSQYHLGSMYLAGMGTSDKSGAQLPPGLRARSEPSVFGPRYLKAARHYLEKAAAQNHPDACCALASMIMDGTYEDSGRVDLVAAKHFLAKGISLGEHANEELNILHHEHGALDIQEIARLAHECTEARERGVPWP